MRRLIYMLLAAATSLVAVSACDTGVAYDRYEPTQVEGWERNDTLVFDVPGVRRGGRYAQGIGLRISSDYPFTALWLLVERVVEPGHRVYSDTVSCRLYDGKGNILGSGVSRFQYDFALPDIYLHKGDSMHVSVRHVMKREILPGISDVGFRLALK